MTSILKPKNPNPSNTLTYNNMPLKKLISMNAVFLNIMIEKPPFLLLTQEDKRLSSQG